MDRRARGLDFEPGSWDPFQQLACVGVEAVECFPLGFAWDGEAAVTNQSHARHRDEVLELGGWTAAEDDHIRQQRYELLQCLKGFGLSASRGGVLHDLGQGAVEVGNQDYFAWLYTS